jgi:hypothetical protein
MKSKNQTIYDIHSDQFKYLKEDKNVHSHRVDINVLNKKLNIAKKSSFYRTTLIFMFSLLSLFIVTLVSIKF